MSIQACFDGCIIYLYGSDGNTIASTRILEHNVLGGTLRIENIPELEGLSQCQALIVSQNKSYIYLVAIIRMGTSMQLKLYKGREKEQRKEKRYATEGKVRITHYIYNGKGYKLHTNIEVDLINVSVSGVRLKGKYNTLIKGDMFSMTLNIGKSVRVLTAEVKNLKNIETMASEYGCALVGCGVDVKQH